AHLLVVIAGRAAGGEGIAEPEVVLAGNFIGDIGEGRGALVRRHDQIRIVAVIALHLGRRDDLALLEVVGDVEQAADENPVTGDPFGEHFVTRATARQAARDETALGPARNDDRILDLLRLDQTQHFGAVILFAIRPAQPTAGDLAATQVNALHSRRIDENLIHRHLPRHFRDRARIELEAEIALGLAVGVGLIEVGAQGCLDQRQIAPENAVLVEHRDLVQRTQDRLFEALLLVRQVFLAQLARQVETSLEEAYQLARDIGVIEQRAGDIAQVEAHANLLEVAPVGPQQRHLTPGQAGREHQAVEGIVLGRAGMNLDEGILQRLVDFQQIDFQPLGIGEGEIVDPVFPPFLASQTERKLAQHAQAQVLQDRQHVRQRQWPIGMVELAMQAVLHRGDRLVEAHYQGLLIAQAEDVLHVHRCRMRGETLAITGGKAFRKVAQDRRATGFAEALVDQARIIVLPGAAGLDDFLLQLRRIDLQWPGGIQAQQELHTVEHRLGKVGGEFAAAGPEAIDQHLLDAQARLGRVTVARDIDQAIAEAAVGIDPQEQPQLVALLDLHDGDGGIEQLVEGHLEQLVAGQHLQYLDQFLAQVCRLVEARTPNHLRHLAADIGNPPHALGIDRGGEEAEKTTLLDHPALVIHHPQRYVIRI